MSSSITDPAKSKPYWESTPCYSPYHEYRYGAGENLVDGVHNSIEDVGFGSGDFVNAEAQREVGLLRSGDTGPGWIWAGHPLATYLNRNLRRVSCGGEVLYARFSCRTGFPMRPDEFQYSK
jgi:hypothetical protein